MDGFEVAMHTLIRGRARTGAQSKAVARRVADTFGTPIDTGSAVLTTLAPGAERMAEAGASRVASLGVPAHRAEAIVALARLVSDGALRMEPGGDVPATHHALKDIGGIDDRLATMIVMRAMHWPDAFPASDGVLQRGAGVSSAPALVARAERWRPWRAYAALHLRLQQEDP
jgi:AraC family transcriptional regulator of adaptative response / DNA-3-methyladenine glycosylase II